MLLKVSSDVSRCKNIFILKIDTSPLAITMLEGIGYSFSNVLSVLFFIIIIFSNSIVSSDNIIICFDLNILLI